MDEPRLTISPGYLQWLHTRSAQLDRLQSAVKPFAEWGKSLSQGRDTALPDSVRLATNWDATTGPTVGDVRKLAGLVD